MRALVLGGAGAVCKETTRDLAEYSNFDEIVVADYNLAAVNQLLESIGDRRLKPLHSDAGNYQAMLDLFPQFDVVVNGLPFKYDYVVKRACVETGLHLSKPPSTTGSVGWPIRLLQKCRYPALNWSPVDRRW
jgi:lysine 6-dehydrogenase